MEKIDFVLLWVDGNDKKWLAEKSKYKTNQNIGNDINRFRDWELLKYWFRGIEKYASWVNKIHFVTYGHIPEWLDVSNPKINIVRHEDIIPKEYLPTFNSNVIQYYLNRIVGISDKFIMFDDDQFVLKETKISDFFYGDKICDVYGESPIFSSDMNDVYPHCLLNNLQCINKYYSKRKIYKKEFFKYFNIRYGMKINFRTLCMLPFSNFIGIYSPHICQAYTKKHYELFWKYCESKLKQCSQNKFRETTDLSTFLIRYIALLEGDFIPRRDSFGKRIELSKNNKKIYNAIKKQKYNVLCINDSNANIEFEKIKEELIKSFDMIFEEKSSFEK